MGTILKYTFYLALILIVYLVGKGIYEGSINDTSTVGDVGMEIENGVKNMAKDASSSIKKNLDKYDNTPKKEIVVD